jgi:opacity protein-like surface antigen
MSLRYYLTTPNAKGGLIMMKKIAYFSHVLSFVLILTIIPLDSTEAQTGGYIGVFGGYTFGNDAQWQTDFQSFDLDVSNTWVVGGKVGYTPPQIKFLSFELEFFFLNPDIDDTIISQSGDLEFYNIMYNMLLKYPDGKIHPYIGAGLGLSVVNISGLVRGGQGKFSDEAGAFGWQFLAGVDLDLSQNWSVDFGVRYFGTNPSFDNDTEIDYKTGIGTLGLTYRF